MIPLTPVAAFVLAFQTAASSPPPSKAPNATTAVAHRAVTPPVIDGKDNDDVWREAPVIKDFRQFQPTEDADPSLPTEAKVAYDAHNFYVFVRAFDSHPDSIKKLLARRDVRICCDQIKIVIDSYHDRRTGFEFAVNPGGVKRDYAMYGDDQQEDDAWDGVWEVATQVDSLGWTAEFRIPLSQLRYAHAPSNVFGFAIWRDIDRHKGERVGWPLYRTSKRGFVSQLGDVSSVSLASVSVIYVLSQHRFRSVGYSEAKSVVLGVLFANAFLQVYELIYGLTFILSGALAGSPSISGTQARTIVLWIIMISPVLLVRECLTFNRTSGALLAVLGAIWVTWILYGFPQYYYSGYAFAQILTTSDPYNLSLWLNFRSTPPLAAANGMAGSPMP